MTPPAPRRGTALLVLGAAGGVAVAAAGLLGPGHRAGRGLPAGAVARVNGRVIDAEAYRRVVDALATDRRAGVDEADRRRVLDRLIDEELLVERGLELGLAEHDVTVRKGISAAMIDAVVAEAETVEPSAADLAAFWEEHRDLFARPGRLRLRQVWVRAPGTDDGAALARARAAAARLRAGEELARVRDALGDPEVVPLPDGPLPPGKLLDYLGPTALRTALGLDVGGVSDPVRSSSGYHVLQVVERVDGTVPVLDEVRDEVRAEFRRRAGDRALRAYLDDLRSRAEIELAPVLP